MSLPFLATYGTLMRSFGRLKSLGVTEQLTFLSRCRFEGTMYHLGDYPGAVPGSAVLHGELFRVESSECWDVLDQYEGYISEQEEASLFVRRTVTLQEPPDTQAWVYWYNREPTGYPHVTSGDWQTFLDNR